MKINWKSVRTEHVTKACELVSENAKRPRVGAKGIFVTFRGQGLPAKHVLRLAYCIANELPLDSIVKFSSGDGTVNRLRELGFDAMRRSADANSGGK